MQPSIGEFLVALLQYGKSAPKVKSSTWAVFAEVFKPCCETLISRAQNYLLAPGSAGHSHERYARYDKSQLQAAVQWYMRNDSCGSLEEACENVGMPRNQALAVAKVRWGCE